MNSSILRTLAAGLTACVCLSGLSESATAQFFSNDTTIQPLDSRLPPNSRFELYDSRIPQQRLDQQRMNERYIRTNAANDLQAYDRSLQGRCADGQCHHRPENGINGTDSTSYRGQRRGGQNYDSAARYQSRTNLTTSWDPTNQPIDSVTGLPMERPRRQDHINGEGHREHCRGGGCEKTNCNCPEGQCDCPVGQRGNRDGQFRQQQMGQPDISTGYDNFNLTRRNNSAPQYLPSSSPYSN
jgi:hypothetical protein